MKLSELVKNHTESMFLTGKLNKTIKLDNGTVLEKGTQSDLLIKKSSGNYHFEALDVACTVDISEIDIIEKNIKPKTKPK